MEMFPFRRDPNRPRKKEKRQICVGGRTIVKPKRPCPPFGAFVKDFRQQHDLDYIDDHNFVSAASLPWRRLTRQEKFRYELRHAEAMVGYREQLAVWKRQKAFLKKPAAAFNLFTKDIWRHEGRRGRSFQQMSTYIAERWRTMSEVHRQQYNERYARGKLIHATTVQAFGNGNDVDLDRSLDPEGDAVPAPVVEE